MIRLVISDIDRGEPSPSTSSRFKSVARCLSIIEHAQLALFVKKISSAISALPLYVHVITNECVQLYEML